MLNRARSAAIHPPVRRAPAGQAKESDPVLDEFPTGCSRPIDMTAGDRHPVPPCDAWAPLHNELFTERGVQDAKTLGIDHDGGDDELRQAGRDPRLGFVVSMEDLSAPWTGARLRRRLHHNPTSRSVVDQAPASRRWRTLRESVQKKRDAAKHHDFKNERRDQPHAAGPRGDEDQTVRPYFTFNDAKAAKFPGKVLVTRCRTARRAAIPAKTRFWAMAIPPTAATRSSPGADQASQHAGGRRPSPPSRQTDPSVSPTTMPACRNVPYASAEKTALARPADHAELPQCARAPDVRWKSWVWHCSAGRTRRRR